MKKNKQILTDEEKRESRKKVMEIIESIITIGLNHLYKWLKKKIIG